MPEGASGVRVFHAGNTGPFTLDGTRTYIVGRTRVAVVDPGPRLADHLDALVGAVRDSQSVALLLSHGHADHVGGVDSLLQKLRGHSDVTVFGSGHDAARHLGEAAVDTDVGPIFALPTPGHTADHVAFHWPAGRALFAGDLVLGRGSTTWVAGYPGCVRDYLASLGRVARLNLEVMYPAHGDPLRDPSAALQRFEDHRRSRIEQVRNARGAIPGATMADLVSSVYSDEVPPELMHAAEASIQAALDYLDEGWGGGREV